MQQHEYAGIYEMVCLDIVLDGAQLGLGRDAEGHCQTKLPCPTALWTLAYQLSQIQHPSVISKQALRSSNFQLCCM